MEQTASLAGGWTLIADNDGAAAVLGAIVELDTDETYTRSELADAAGVPLKELYLSETLNELAHAGLLRPIEDAAEATYAIDDGTAVYEQAVAFETAVSEAIDR